MSVRKRRIIADHLRTQPNTRLLPADSPSQNGHSHHGQPLAPENADLEGLFGDDHHVRLPEEEDQDIVIKEECYSVAEENEETFLVDSSHEVADENEVGEEVNLNKLVEMDRVEIREPICTASSTSGKTAVGKCQMLDSKPNLEEKSIGKGALERRTNEEPVLNGFIGADDGNFNGKVDCATSSNADDFNGTAKTLIIAGEEKEEKNSGPRRVHPFQDMYYGGRESKDAMLGPWNSHSTPSTRPCSIVAFAADQFKQPSNGNPSQRIYPSAAPLYDAKSEVYGQFGIYKNCTHQSCIYSNGNYSVHNLNHKPHGYGILKMSNGCIMECGHWVNGVAHGKGRYTHPNGDIYEGGFNNDKKHGQGILFRASGAVFEEEYAHGKRIQRRKIQEATQHDTSAEESDDGGAAKGLASPCPPISTTTPIMMAKPPKLVTDFVPRFHHTSATKSIQNGNASGKPEVKIRRQLRKDMVTLGSARVGPLFVSPKPPSSQPHAAGSPQKGISPLKISNQPPKRRLSLPISTNAHVLQTDDKTLRPKSAVVVAATPTVTPIASCRSIPDIISQKVLAGIPLVSSALQPPEATAARPTLPSSVSTSIDSTNGFPSVPSVFDSPQGNQQHHIPSDNPLASETSSTRPHNHPSYDPLIGPSNQAVVAPPTKAPRARVSVMPSFPQPTIVNPTSGGTRQPQPECRLPIPPHPLGPLADQLISCDISNPPVLMHCPVEPHPLPQGIGRPVNDMNEDPSSNMPPNSRDAVNRPTSHARQRLMAQAYGFNLRPAPNFKPASASPKKASQHSPARNPRMLPTPPLYVGQRVSVLHKGEGQVAYVGPTAVGTGLWIGIILDDKKGRHDGSINNVRYFHCIKDHGIFVRPNKVVAI